MSSKPKTKVWNRNEGCFTPENGQETENDGGQNEGQNYRSQNPGQQNRRGNQGPQNRGQTHGQQNQRQNQRQQDRGQNSGQQNRGQYYGQQNRGQYFGQQNIGQYSGDQDRGQFSRQQNRGPYSGQQDRGPYSGQQDRGQYSGQQDRGQYSRQQNRGQYSGQQDRGQYSGQQDRGQYSRQQNRGQFSGQQDRGQYSGQQDRGQYSRQQDRGQYSRQQNRGQYSGQQNRDQYSGQQNWGQHDGLLPEPQHQMYSDPPPNMQYPPMMAQAPMMYPAYVVQPMYPMCPMPPPSGPRQPPPLLRDPVQNFDVRQDRQHSKRGPQLPPQGNLEMNGNMRRSTSMRSVYSNGPGCEENYGQNTRPINSRGSKGNNRLNASNDRKNKNTDGKLYKSVSVSHMDDVGRELGARPKQRRNAANEQEPDSGNNQGEQEGRGNFTGKRTGRERGSGRGRGMGGERGTGRGMGGERGTGRGRGTDGDRGTGRGRYSGRGRGYERGRGSGRGRGRPYNRRVSSDSDGSDIQSVCSFSDDHEKETDVKNIHGHLYNSLRRRGYFGPRMRGPAARERRNFAGRGYGPPRERHEKVELERLENKGYRPRGSFRGRGRGYFRGGRGKFFAGRWSQLIGRKENTNTDESKDDLRSSEQQDDFDDSVSIASDISIATSSLADDISETGSQDGKSYVISLDDIHTIKLATLKNRLMRYKKKLAVMRKQDEDKNEIRKYQDGVNMIRTVVKERETLKRKEKEEENDSNNTKPGQEKKRNNKGKSAEQLSSSSSEDEEVKRKQVLTKSKRVHVVTVVKGHVSYKPKSRNKNIGKPKIKNDAAEPSETESEDEIEDVEQESDKEKNDLKKKKQTKKRNRRNKRQNKEKEVIEEEKTICSEGKEKRLTDILSRLDILEPTKNKPETKQADFSDSSTKGIGAQSKSRGNSVTDFNDLPKGHCLNNHASANTEKTKIDKTEKVRKTSESYVQGPDVNEVFKFMVKTLEGKGSPEEIKRESGLFPIDLEENTWFRRHKNRFTLIEKDGIFVTVLVLNRDATYCLDYITNRSCKKEDCKRYHICKHLLNGNCAYGERCKFSHDFLDERNINVSKRLGYGNVFSNDEICSIVKARYPHTCSSWLENGTCEDRGCIGLHLCPQFILGQCLEGETCPLVHNKFSEHNKPIVDAYGMSKFHENLFRKMIYMSRQLELESKDVDKDENIHKAENENGQANQELYNREKLTRQKGTEEAAIDKPICERFLIGKCHRQNCKHLHCKMLSPYIWQVKLSGTWINLKELEEIEQSFCNNQEFYEDIRLVHNNMEFSVKLIFRPDPQAIMKLIGTSDGGERVEARRLSTLSYKDGGGSSECFKTQWRWYWRDDYNRWQLFEPDALQHTLEVKFLANQKEFNYSRDNYRFKYIVDFKEMTQRNIDTNKQRYIHRCPVFVSQDDVKSKHYPPPLAAAPVIETPLPQSWVPWDVAHPFELVRIDQSDPKYHQVSDSFFSTLDRGQIRIDAIFRMQNHKLWTLFCNQQRSMEANLKRIGNETVVDKRYLFHGTDSLDAVRGISINNFDVRVSGKNATMYGDGAYFARDAKYSHSYTRGPDRLMFMVTVLVGHYTKGDKSYRRPPNKPGSDHELYDSCVNDMTNPSIFIVFDKNQYYPEYLIQYHKLYEEVDPVSYPSSASRATGTVRSSSWRTTPQQSAPAIPPRSVPSSPTDTSFVGTGYTANQNTGAQAVNTGSSVPTPSGLPRDEARAKKKDDSCSIQ